MRRTTLAACLAARRAGESGALVSDLASGAQALWRDGVWSGELTLPEAARDEVAERVAADRSGLLAAPAGIFAEVWNPPLRLLIVGAVHIAQPLAAMASVTGFAVTVIDPRAAFATDARFPGIALLAEWPDEAMARLKPDRRTAIVTLSHDPKIDDPALSAAIGSEAYYVGALGSRKTHSARLQRLESAGLGRAARRIRGPVGLALEAETPAEIAVSILAEIVAVRRGSAIAS